MTEINTHFPKKLLVVDDEREELEMPFLDYFSKDIRLLRYEFDFVSSRKEALEKLDKNHYDLELVDIVMPDDTPESSLKSGLTLIGQVNQKYPDLKSMLISGYGDNTEALENQNLPLHVCDFFKKPIDLDKLKQSLEKHLALNQSIVVKKTNENQEKKIHYNTLFKKVRELNSDLNYKLTIENIQRFELEQFEELRKNLPFLEAQVREEHKRREILIQRDLEREKQGKLPLLPLLEGSVYEKSFTYESKQGKISHYKYLYLNSPNSSRKNSSSKIISPEHLNDIDVRQIIEKKLGKSINPSDFSNK